MIAAETLGWSSTPRQRALQLLGIRADGVPAAFAVRKRHHAIHVGRQRLAFETRAISSAVCAAQLLAATTAM